MTKLNYDFKTVIDRYGTFSTQWDFVKDRFGKEGLLPFTISDMDFKVPQGVSDTLISAAQKGLFGYTRWNNADFKNAIKKWFRNRYNAEINEDFIVYSPSVIYSMAKLINQYSERGEKVITFSPCYDAFINTIYGNGRKLVQFNIENGIDFNELEKVFKEESPSVFLLCNPHNPNGIVWSEDYIKKFIELCNNYHVAIISDEIHMDIVRQGIQANTIAKFFKDITGSCAVITSASKSFNIPGLGCSYALIKEEKDRIDFLYNLKKKDALSSVPYLGMLATIECYNNQAEWLDQLRTYIDGNFEYLQKFLKDKLNIDYKIPEATYLGWIDISNSGIEMDELQYEMVEHQNVAIMDGKVYGNGGANHLRFNLGASEIKIQNGLDRLYKAFAVVQSNNEV